MTTAVSPLRSLRLGMAMPMTLEEVAALVRGYGLRCTAGHLSAVERGIKPPGPKLRGALAAIYRRTPASITRATVRTLNGHAGRHRRRKK